MPQTPCSCVIWPILSRKPLERLTPDQLSMMTDGCGHPRSSLEESCPHLISQNSFTSTVSQSTQRHSIWGGVSVAGSRPPRRWIYPVCWMSDKVRHHTTLPHFKGFSGQNWPENTRARTLGHSHCPSHSLSLHFTRFHSARS